MIKVNVTLNLEREDLNKFDNWLRQYVEVTDFKILPDTKELYENDPHFKKIVKEVRKAKEMRDKYINKKIK